LETNEAEDLSKRVRRGLEYWLTILSMQCGQLGSGCYRESADRKGGGDHSMRELRCFSGGPRGWEPGG
jgi:hypothetical protein